MAVYQFAYNAGTPKARTERHEFALEEAAVKLGRSRVGFIDPTIGITQLLDSGAIKLIGGWAMVAGMPEWTASK